MTTERTFHPFQQLPVELRLEIWNLSLPAPQSLHASWRAVPLSTTSEEERILQRRIVSLRQRFDRPTNRARRVLRSAYQNLSISSGGSDDAIIPPTHNPALLGVNQEARAVALERYHYRPAYLRASPPRYIDFEFDTLCVQSAELFDFFEPIGLAVLMGADLKGAEVKSAGLGDISKVQRLAVHHYFHFHEEIFRYIESVMSILPHFESLRELEVTPHYDPVHSVSCPCRQWHKDNAQIKIYIGPGEAAATLNDEQAIKRMKVRLYQTLDAWSMAGYVAMCICRGSEHWNHL